MKKLTFVALLAIAVASFVASCGKSSSNNANLKNDVDSFSYAIGMAQTQGLKMYLTQMDIDTTYMDAFIKGIQIGQQISNRMVKGINHELFGDDSTKTISLKNFMAGFVAGVKGKKGAMTMEQAQAVAQAKMMAIKSKNMEKTYGAYKKQCQDWLAANAKKPGVKTLPSGLQYKVIKEGNGAMPKDTSVVEVKYEGRFINGKVFDSTKKNNGGNPIQLRANQVIKGWTEALVHMPAGSVWEIYVPYDLAYGDREQGDVKPYSALIFTIELVSVK